jgi:hypothetical protein
MSCIYNFLQHYCPCKIKLLRNSKRVEVSLFVETPETGDRDEVEVATGRIIFINNINPHKLLSLVSTLLYSLKVPSSVVF